MCSGRAQMVPRVSLVLLAVSCLLLFLPEQAFADLNAKEHLEAGDRYLTTRQLQTALDHYHRACGNAYNENALQLSSCLRRAVAFLSLNRLRHATKDLTTVLELKPDFSQARKRRADALVKLGQLTEAKEDFTMLGDSGAIGDVTLLEQTLREADQAFASGAAEQAVSSYSRAIESISNDAELRMKRAKAYIDMGQLGEAISDVKLASQLWSANTKAFHLRSQLEYQTGNYDGALEQIRECVKLDGDDDECFAFYKFLKKFAKLANKVKETLANKRYAEVLLNVDKLEKFGIQESYYISWFAKLRCECLTRLTRSAPALQACNRAAELAPNDAFVLMHRGIVFEQLEDFESSVNDFQRAHELNPDYGEISEGLKRAQRLLKNSLKRDYYKILGVSRTAQKKEIIKAYRKLAQEWHPDKFESEEDKVKAEKKFMDIAAAKEVLTDPEKRKMFDNGEDPLDAEEERERASQRSNPFGHGFNPFGGGT
eukprot:gene5798-9024_t